MPFEVFLTADAARDLEELYRYIALHDAPGKAELPFFFLDILNRGSYK